jgi:single-stranded DNA-binding protein
MNQVENANTHTVTLTGYLGKDPAARDTRVRTTTRTATRTERFVFEYQGRRLRDADDRLDDHVEYELTTTPRTFAVLTLATHRRHRERRTTTWHRVVAWNADRQHFGIFRLRKGDRVEAEAGSQPAFPQLPEALLLSS